MSLCYGSALNGGGEGICRLTNRLVGGALNMGAGLVGQLCRAARREAGVQRPSTGSKSSWLSTGKPSYLGGRGGTHTHTHTHTHTP